MFKLHFGRLTGKAYTKGERVLRFEAIAHNIAELRCGSTVRQAGYDLRKLRGKHLVDKPGRTRRYQVRAPAARTIRPAHPARPSHRPDPRRGAQPPDGTQTRALDTRRP